LDEDFFNGVFLVVTGPVLLELLRIVAEGGDPEPVLIEFLAENIEDDTDVMQDAASE